MNITRLQFEGYRNLKDNFILPKNGINVIHGDNAQGKTNLLEALWLFNGSRSFRGAKDNELIGFGRDFARLTIMFTSAQREQTAEILITGGKKIVTLNGVEKSSASELSGSICSVIFTPDHLSLVKEGPAERRKFIDNAIVQIKPSYYSLLNRYNQTLSQRNALLKEINYKKELLDTLFIWDEHLSQLGAVITEQRLKYFDMLCESAKKYHNGLSSENENLKMEYAFSYDYDGEHDVQKIKSAMLDKLIKNREEDLQNRVTSCGVHRDDIDIFINEKKTRIYGSQGQQRSVVLSLKLAEAEILRETIDEEPIILLDDVLSELDSARQRYLLNNINDRQVFITCCDPSNVSKLSDGKVFMVKGGAVKKQGK